MRPGEKPTMMEKEECWMVHGPPPLGTKVNIWGEELGHKSGGTFPNQLLRTDGITLILTPVARTVGLVLGPVLNYSKLFQINGGIIVNCV